MPKAPSGCRKSGFRHLLKGSMAPLGRKAKPCYARLFSHLPHTPRGGFRQAARSIRAANPAGRGAHPAGRGAAAFGGRGPLAPGLPNQMAGAGDFGPRPSHLRALRALPPPPRLANRQTPMRAGAAGPALCALRPPYSSGQTYRPLPLVFSPYWMAWTGQRLMQLVQR